MKIAILGDTHFDFYFNSNSVVSKRSFDAKFKSLCEKSPADVLLIPGDIGHYNTQNIQCLRHFQRFYPRIVVCFGNHDSYLITKSMVKKYQWGTGRIEGSLERVLEMKLLINQETGIDYVDGNIIEIDGIRIGGASGWYDGSLLLNAGTTYDEVQMYWRLHMNDANMIYPNGNNGAKFDTLFHKYKYRMDKVHRECDIMMTHVSPLSEWRQFAEMYNYQKPLEGFYKNYSSTHEALQDYRAFYCFDGKDYLENGSMTHWIFGHTHRSFERQYITDKGNEIKILCNSIGPPKKGQRGAKINMEIKVIEVTPRLVPRYDTNNIILIGNENKNTTSTVVSVLSDLHLDFHFRSFQQTKEEVKKFFDPIFIPVISGVRIAPADVLIIAGDIGHYNSDNKKIIEFLRELYFKNIICVLGNHDYFLVNRIQQDDYDGDSFNRIEEMREMLNSIDGVYCLNGDVVEINGVRFGGADGWYDGQYMLHNLNPHFIYAMHHVRENWRYTMNDAKLIRKSGRYIENFDDIWKIEKPKIEAVYKMCDVIITHVSPSIKPEHIPEGHYRKDKGTAFFCFNGEEYVKTTSAKAWIYGHTHIPNSYKWHGVHMLANQLGYPGERKREDIRDCRFEIWPKPNKDEE